MTTFKKLFVLVCLCGAALTVNADIDATLSPATLDLGDVAVGSTGSEDATIGIAFNGQGDLNGNANNGTVTSITIINPVGNSLVASQGCVGVDFSANRESQVCLVEVSCSPGAVGAISGTLELQFDLLNNSGTQIQTSSLTCNGVAAPPVTGPASIPATGVYGLALLFLLLVTFGWMGLRQQNRR